MPLGMEWNEIAWAHGYHKISVTSGVGVRSYYLNKCGFNLLPGESYPNQSLYWSWKGLLTRLEIRVCPDPQDSPEMYYLLIAITMVVTSIVLYGLV